METIAPPSKSQSDSLASGERVPHFSLCISSLFPPAKSPSGSPHSPERVPHSAPPVHSLFPAANSRSGSSASNETYQRFSSLIPSIFPPTKSVTNSSENDKRTTNFSSSLGVFLSKTKQSQPNNLVISKTVPNFYPSIESIFPAARSDSDSLFSDDNNPKYSIPPSTTQSYFPSVRSSSDSDLSYMNVTNTETSAEKFSFFSRPHHLAGYQDKAKISRLLFPMKGNNQLSPTAESMQLQFPQDWPGNSYNKEDVPGFQSFPDRTFDLNEYEPNGSYVGDDLHQFSLSNDQLPFPAPSINKSPPLLEEADKRWSI
ncbi:hypothetical protein CMV_017288 [Castanea mollissima]|uniref:Uncharacterized protein n=1 Tax=Castanea mollissima TaxID=60419 RepID=A0A8J4QTA1_9ROSI|nr:hypothetical protein CMV_017288 [Castanea mollissima]